MEFPSSFSKILVAVGQKKDPRLNCFVEPWTKTRGFLVSFWPKWIFKIGVWTPPNSDESMCSMAWGRRLIPPGVGTSVTSLLTSWLRSPKDMFAVSDWITLWILIRNHLAWTKCKPFRRFEGLLKGRVKRTKAQVWRGVKREPRFEPDLAPLFP